jgi:DNA-binding transcriptional LysR family regulator
MFELRQLECFVAVAEELHFGRAAMRMNMTQPPLSRQIRLLEHELNLELFLRTSRSVRLTLSGTVFLHEARHLLALAENAASSARRIARGEAGLLNLGFTAGSSYSFLPKLLAHIRASVENVDIVLHEMKTSSQIEALHSHKIDVGMLRRTSDAKNLEFVCVARDLLMLAVPSDHRLAIGRRPTLKDLEGEPFITFSPSDGPYFKELIEQLFKNAGVNPHYVQQVGQIHSILALVSSGQGMALVPESAKALHFNRTVIRKMRMPPSHAELHLAWETGNSNPTLPRFLKTVLKEFSIRTEEPVGSRSAVC